MGDGDSFAAARSNLPELSLSLSLSQLLLIWTSFFYYSSRAKQLDKARKKTFHRQKLLSFCLQNLPPRYVCIEARLVSNVKSSWTLAPPPL